MNQFAVIYYLDRVLKAVPATGVPNKQTIILPPQPAAIVNIPSHPYERQYYSGPRGTYLYNSL